MFQRPRCRNFVPLVTTQIRLRNLIKISGVNLRENSDKKSSLYFTLHLSAFSKPFYTSERLESRNNIEWPEINCQQIQDSCNKFVCVRVWRTSDSAADELLFLWGVYFSGLVHVQNHELRTFKENTLLFHLFGGIFTSPDQVVCEAQSNCDQISDKYSSSPNFSVTNGSHDLTTATPPRSIDHSGANSVVDLMNESKYLKVRYAQLEFAKTEITPSYTLEKLLKIQEIQRRIRQSQESSKMLADRICTKSAACLNLDLIMRKPIFYEPQKQPGMGRTLSRLLAQQNAPPKPETILKVHEIRVKIECARFRIKLLTQERDRFRQSNKGLEKCREKLKDENTENETMIWNSMRSLGRENLKTHQDKLSLQRDVLMNVRLALGETKRCLLKELNEIYTVRKNSKGQFTINDIHLPDAESYGDTTVSSTDISIALGYVAHAIMIVARILNIPLRNPIKHEGSRSKIMDNIKILPPTDRIFPLFCRVIPPPNVLLYGVYLLNQNISQLKHILGMGKGDLRATLANLCDLMNASNCEVMSIQINENMNARQVDNSTSSVDSVPMNILINLPSTLSPTSPRVSRSLDDFDELESNFRTQLISTSPCGLDGKFNSSAPDLTSTSPDPMEQNSN